MQKQSYRHPFTGELYATRACRDTGHDWQRDVTGTYQTCARHGCHAVERLMGEQWTAVHPSVVSPCEQQHTTSSGSYQQQSFWSAQQHTERPLHLESVTLLTPEQRAHFATLEREYYCLSSGMRKERRRS